MIINVAELYHLLLVVTCSSKKLRESPEASFNLSHLDGVYKNVGKPS